MLTYRSSVVKYIERGRNGTKMNKKGSRQKMTMACIQDPKGQGLEKRRRPGSQQVGGKKRRT